jgi:hypothetical protein
MFRMIDDFDNAALSSTTSSSSSSTSSSRQSVQTMVSVPELTDRPEWSKAQLRLRRYGADLERVSPINDLGLRVNSGPGSIVDAYSEQMRDGKYPFPLKVMLTGERGVGKSIALNQLVMYARSKKDWLVLFVPNGWKHVQGGTYVEPIQDERFGRLYDNKLMSVELLRGFWRAHHADLAVIKFTRPEALLKYSSFVEQFSESWGREASMPGKEKLGFIQLRALIEGEDCDTNEDAKDADVLKGWDFRTHKVETLEDLVRFGIAFRDLAGKVVLDLVQDLEQLESKKVLIAVDQYNCWSAQSAYFYDNVALRGSDLVVPRALSFLDKRKAEGDKRAIKNGLFVCAESLTHPEGAKELYNSAANSVPLTLQVPHYSQVEFLSALMYYTEQLCVHEGVSTQNFLAYRMLVNSNPRLARTDSCTFFMRIAMGEIKGDYMLMEDGFDMGDDDSAGDYDDDDDDDDDDDEGYDA